MADERNKSNEISFLRGNYFYFFTLIKIEDKMTWKLKQFVIKFKQAKDKIGYIKISFELSILLKDFVYTGIIAIMHCKINI